MDYTAINKYSWNKRTEKHFNSEFYNNKAFVQSPNSLNSIELELLGDVSGKKILHLQCHFGQDSISLEKLGAKVTAVDFSEAAIEKANQLNQLTNSTVNFICSDVYLLPDVLNDNFDIVFTSYGTIGWLPDINKWALIVSHFMHPGGQFVFAEFHPAVWMFDNNFEKIQYRYFNDEAIMETENTYADDAKEEEFSSVTWNHSLAEVITSLLKQDLELLTFREFDYSPYDCLSGMVEQEKGKYRIEKISNKMPLVYALAMQKKL